MYNDFFAPAVTVGPPVSGSFSTADMAAKLALAATCPKWTRCSAAYCPAIGGKHLKGERVCPYLMESVKAFGLTRLREHLPMPLADVVIREGVRQLNSTGPLQKPLERASKQGSRMESMARAAGFRASPNENLRPVSTQRAS